MRQYCDEHPDLVELCTKCKRDDCVGAEGCKTYQTRKRRLEQKPPAIMVEELPAQYDTAETLLRCNEAIAALEALNSDAGCSKLFPVDKIEVLLRVLRAARIEVYAPLIDWNSIAETIKNGE